MNYAFGTGHSPQQVPESYSDSYKGVYDKGWDEIRQKRFERQKQLGIIPANAVLTSDPTVKPWNSLSEDQKKLYTRFMENYAGYMTQADEEVGKLYWDERNRRAIFNYHPDFVKKGLEIAPLTASVKGGQQKVCLYPAIRINSIRDR